MNNNEPAKPWETNASAELSLHEQIDDLKAFFDAQSQIIDESIGRLEGYKKQLANTVEYWSGVAQKEQSRTPYAQKFFDEQAGSIAHLERESQELKTNMGDLLTVVVKFKQDAQELGTASDDATAQTGDEAMRNLLHYLQSAARTLDVDMSFFQRSLERLISNNTSFDL